MNSYWKLALFTLNLLMVPLIAMQFSSQVNWTLADFFVMGGLCFSTGSAYLLLAARLPRHKLFLAIGCCSLFILIWLELAIGVLTNLGN